MDIAGSWYSSGTFWAASAVAVSIIIGAATTIVTYIVGFPQRRLDYGMPVVAPLLTAPDGVRSEVELRHRGALLNEPHVLEVVLVGRGRRDIASSAFDGGSPIELDIGIRIIEILQTTSSPSMHSIPVLTINGTVLNVGPSLIGKKQRITFSILADGATPCLSCRAPLVDVKVQPLSDEEEERWVRPWKLVFMGFISSVFVRIAIESKDSSGRWAYIICGAVLSLLSGVYMGISMEQIKRRSRRLS